VFPDFYLISECMVSEFPITKTLPTYLFGFIAGPLKGIELTNTYKNIPMSLYSRESLYVHLLKQKDLMSEVTNQAMEFYEKFF